MPIATLSVDLVAKLASFEADLKKAAGAAERSSQQMASAFGIARAGVAGLVGALSVQAFTEFVTRTIDGVDALNDLADATGASVENLSALEDVAVRTGTSMDTVGDAVIKLNKALGDAKGGSDQARAFEAIGLSVKQLKEVDPAEALRQVAVALSGFADDGNKARLVQEIFGKSLKQVAPLLNDLAKAGQLNATVTTEQAKQAEEFNQQIKSLSKNSSDAARSFVEKLLPSLNGLFEGVKSGKFTEFAQELDVLAGRSAALGVPLQTLAVLAANVGFVFRGVGTEIGALTAQAAALARGEFSGIGAIRDAALEDAKTAREELDAFERRVLGIKAQAADIKGPEFRPSQNYGEMLKKSLPDVKVDPEIEKAEKAYLKLAESIGLTAAAAAEEIAGGDKLSASQQLRNKVLQDLNNGEVKYTASQRDSILAALKGTDTLGEELRLRLLQIEAQRAGLALLNQQIDAIDRETIARTEANQGLRDQIEEFGKTAQAIEQLRIKRLEDAASQEETTLQLLRGNEGSREELVLREHNLAALRTQIGLRKTLAAQDAATQNDAAGGAQRALDDYLLNVSRAGVATQEAVSRSIGTLENDLTSSLAKGKLSVRSFVDSILQEVIRLQVVRPLLASIFGGGAGGLQAAFSGTSLGSSGFGTGAAYGNQDFGGYFADGGMLGAGKWGIAGEKGPEIIKGPAQVVPSSAMTQPAGPTFNFYGEISEANKRYVDLRFAQFQAQMARGR